MPRGSAVMKKEKLKQPAKKKKKITTKEVREVMKSRSYERHNGAIRQR